MVPKSSTKSDDNKSNKDDDEEDDVFYDSEDDTDDESSDDLSDSSVYVLFLITFCELLKSYFGSSCRPCPVVKPIFLCGSDNRTYSSICRLDYHNCIHHTVIKVSCKGFCPCKGK